MGLSWTRFGGLSFAVVSPPFHLTIAQALVEFRAKAKAAREWMLSSSAAAVLRLALKLQIEAAMAMCAAG
jgi:hypothetical protein